MRVPLSRDFVMSTAWNRGAFGAYPEPGGVHVLTEVLHQPVVCRHVVLLAALLVQQECPLVVAEAIVLDVHCDDGADTSKGVEHGADQRPVAESRDPVY